MSLVIPHNIRCPFHPHISSLHHKAFNPFIHGLWYLCSVHDFMAYGTYGWFMILWLMISLLDGVVMKFWHIWSVLKLLIVSILSLVERSVTSIAIDGFTWGSLVQVLEKWFQKGHDCYGRTTKASERSRDSR